MSRGIQMLPPYHPNKKGLLFDEGGRVIAGVFRVLYLCSNDFLSADVDYLFLSLQKMMWMKGSMASQIYESLVSMKNFMLREGCLTARLSSPSDKETLMKLSQTKIFSKLAQVYFNRIF
jgi:hypothetical protein